MRREPAETVAREQDGCPRRGLLVLSESGADLGERSDPIIEPSPAGGRPRGLAVAPDGPDNADLELEDIHERLRHELGELGVALRLDGAGGELPDATEAELFASQAL